ncbi:hypothetical protein OIO90_002530 [Microbotryomycetes sp. JL221]|nr:hypothetical protein OIO90_002530 [Microbotryomycetes sp. JL221]
MSAVSKPTAECRVFLDNFPLPLPTGEPPAQVLRPAMAAGPAPPAPDATLCKVENVVIPGKAAPGLYPHDLRLLVVRPNNDDIVPAVLVFHGGGAIVGAPEMDFPLLEYLAKAGFACISTDYRLAPESPYPAQFDDAESAWDYLHSAEGSKRLGVNPEQTIVYGSSAGSWVSFGLTSRLVKRQEKNLPAIVALDSTLADDRQIYPRQAEGHPFAKYFVWSVQNSHDANSERFEVLGHFAPVANITLRTAYVYGGAEPPIEAAPLRSDNPEIDFAGYPPFYINSCELDSLGDHGIALTNKLLAAGVSVEFHQYRGATHAFSSLMPMSNLAQSLYAELVRVFKQALQ